MKQNNRRIGELGEKIARRWLRKASLKILESNYRNKWGEVDIVAEEKVGNEVYVVFVEVKTKVGDDFGEPWEMINRDKLRRVRNMGHLWCDEHQWEGLCRVDVVGVWLKEGGGIEQVKHWRNVQL